MLTATNKRIYQLSSSVEENGDSWIALRATISLVGLNRHPYFYLGSLTQILHFLPMIQISTALGSIGKSTPPEFII